MLHQTNILRLYASASGNKFYYGGLGNEIDYTEGAKQISGALAVGWEATLDTAEADLRDQLKAHPNAQVNLYGFSRGAAEAVEFARRIKDKKLGDVNFLGLFDPVYSRGLPGSWSFNVDPSKPGNEGNFVHVILPSNVHHAGVIYAQHDERSMFKYAAFTYDEGTHLMRIKSPGQHCDIGGHWENVAPLVSLNLHNMAIVVLLPHSWSTIL